MVAIYQTIDKSEIAFIKSLLMDAKIPFFIENENTSGIAFGRVAGFMTVMVPETEAENAKELLKEIIK